MSLIQQSYQLTSTNPPAVSQDLWTATLDRKTRATLRAVSDDILEKSSEAISCGLPRKIIELTDLINRSKSDESCIFNSKWDTKWINNSSLSPITPQVISPSSVTGFSVYDMRSSTNLGGNDSGKVGQPITTTTTTRKFSISQQCGGTNELTLPNSISVCRPPTHILQLWEILEGHNRQIIDLLDLVQVYLIMKTPPAEEGNNTGVEIQQQCARTLVEARRFVVGCESYLKLYHTQRAKLASKCLKYPQLEDYQRALVERDHEECKDCRYLLVRLRVQCIAVTDVLHKNFEKVNDPKGISRGGGTVGMY